MLCEIQAEPLFVENKAMDGRGGSSDSQTLQFAI
jgi:hypothetical protein